MKNVFNLVAVVVFIGCVVGSSTSLAQGYDWEWPPRFPRQMPTMFYGIEVSAATSMHNGNLPYVEDLIPCCEFTSGQSAPLQLGVFVEDWLLPDLSVSGGLGVTLNNVRFTAPARALVDAEFGVIQTEYIMNVSLTNFALRVGARYRLFGTMFSIGSDMRVLVNASNSVELSERVVSPDDYFFSNNPPSKEVVLPGTISVADVTGIVLEPSLSLHYDIPLSMGIVLQPSAFVAVPLGGLDSSSPWTYLSVGGLLRLSKGF